MLGRRHDTGGEQLAHVSRRPLGQGAQRRVKGDVQPPPRLAVEDRPGGDRHLQHLLQAHCLRAELDLVGAMRLRPTALVLHGERRPAPRRIRQGRARRVVVADAAELHPVGDARDAQPARDETKRRRQAHVAPRLVLAAVDPLVQDAPRRRERVLRPDALHVDERALPPAEHGVLQGGKRHQILI